MRKMNQQWQYTNLPSHAAYQQPPMSNGYTSPQWSPMQFPVSSPFIHTHENTVIYPQFSPMSCRNNCFYYNNQSMFSTSGCEVAGSVGQVWPPVHHPPNSRISMTRADNMTVEQTAEWVRTLARYNSWAEADEYAKIFAESSISGFLLQKLTNKILKEDLGIAKSGHRLEIMSVIKCLFPKNAPSKHFAELNTPQQYETMAESEGDTGLIEDIESSIPTRSPSVSSIMVYAQSNGDVETIEPSSSKKPSLAVHTSLCKDRTAKSNRKSDRARPSRPLVYKTLRKAKLRSGKCGLAKTLCYLPRGSIVVINQIKGRSGRVVVQNQHGRYKTAGWVTLYTKDNQQLLKKYNPPTKDHRLMVE